MSLRAGSLNRLIRIERRLAGEDAAGQPHEGWDPTPVAEVWANVKGATGMASIRQTSPQDNVAASVNSYSLRIRYREGIDAGMRVVLNGTPFDIKQVRMDYAGREWTDLVCEQGGNDG